MKLIGYCRVSTAHQVERGSSLDDQEARIRAWCQGMGYELVGVVREDGSASTLNRPRFQEALANVFEQGVADGIVGVKLDRLTRSVRDFCELVERFDKGQRALIAIEDALDTSTAAGRLVATIIATVSQWEREVIGERTKAALGAKRARGECVGRAPVGWKHAGSGGLVPLDADLVRVGKARALRESGLSFRAIMSELNLRSTTNVRSLLNAPLRSEMVERGGLWFYPVE